MPYRVFCVPATAGECDEAATLNAFLRSRKIVAVGREFIQDGAQSKWCFCVEYLDGIVAGQTAPQPGMSKVDYRDVLDDAQFARFRVMREARKKLAEEEGVPVYAVFTNEQLAELARREDPPDEAALKKLAGFGDKKAARYGARFLALVAAEGVARAAAAEGTKEGE